MGCQRSPRSHQCQKSNRVCHHALRLLTLVKIATSLVALSTMEAEYIALSTSMRKLVPLCQPVKEIAVALRATELLTVRTHSTVFEDSNGALALANLPSILLSTSCIGFFEHVCSGQIQVVKVATTAQVANIFTKGLAREIFERILMLLMGW